MPDQQYQLNYWELMKKNFPLLQFIVGGVIPILIFYSFYKYNQPLYGAMIAIGWEVGVLIINYLIAKHLNMFAALALPFTFVELLTTVLTSNFNYYLASEAIGHALWAIVYFGSLLFSRPLILIFAKAMMSSKAIEDFTNSELYISAFKILTIIWGTVYLIASILLILAQLTLPLESFLSIRIILGTPLLIFLICFSFWFPSWNLRRHWNQPVEFLKDNELISVNNNETLNIGKWEIQNSSVKTPYGKPANFSAVIDIRSVSENIVKGQYTVTGDIKTDVSFKSKVTYSNEGNHFFIRSFNMDVPCKHTGDKIQMATPGDLIILNKVE